ncbi:MAG TPA: hypothetical protein VFD73_14720, partial [Gemmatimonadales bacterium]|nr:hypothetical protein [Gemmatimonadales bacterium]
MVTSTAAAQVSGGATVSPTGSKSITGGQFEEIVRVLRPLVESYGVSGMEAPVRATVERLLPRQIRRETDSAGNLWVTLGQGDPTVVFIAHLDEVGFRVSAI